MDFYTEPTSEDEALKECEILKLQANSLFATGSYSEASKLYARSYIFLKKYNILEPIFSSIVLNLLLAYNKLELYSESIKIASENKVLVCLILGINF